MRIICVLLLALLVSGCAHQLSSSQQPQNPFKDPDYLTYLNYIHQMDAMVANGDISKADAETRKYDAWVQYKTTVREKNYQRASLYHQAVTAYAAQRVADNLE